MVHQKVEELSSSLWSGDRPKNGQDAKLRICSAALACLKRLGFEKTTMSDIAKEAGIARPTLYKHFKSKDEVFFAAIDNEAFAFAESVVAHARQFSTIEDRVVETIIYVVKEFPHHPYLSLVLMDGMATALRMRAFSDEATLVFSQMTAEPLLELRPDLALQGIEMTEVMSRFAISFILFPGKYAADYNGLRALIKARILPGLVG
jgi:AcrR family transcriptional regulator